jgi:hypothetical protein
MTRAIVVGTSLIVLGAAASFVFTRRTPTEQATEEYRVVPSRRLSVGQTAPPASYDAETGPRVFGAPRQLPVGDRHSPAVEKRLEALENRLEEEAAERRRLAEQLENLKAQLAAGGGGANQPTTVQVTHEPPPQPPAAPAAPAAAAPLQSNAPDSAPIDYSVSAMERALTAAGLDAETAADIKFRQDDLAMNEMYLRDQAMREQWLDTPRFAEEMGKIDAERTSIRDEIGDDAYDRYLFALGQTNRVRVDDVLSESPAAGVGLQTGDMIIRYGETRIFAPRDLVDQTHGGSLGETVRLEVMRNGQRFEVEVPRGPLGLRVNPIQDMPDAS